MASFLFPADDVAELKKSLYNDYQIEIPAMSYNGYSALRISIQGYNSEDEVDYLVETLKKFI